MNCEVCESNKLNTKVTVKEMMFGSKSEYSYYICESCGCLQKGSESTQDSYPKPLYDQNYYSFSLNKIDGFRKYLKFQLILNSVRVAINGGGLLKFFINPRRAGGAYALRGILQKSSSLLDVGCGDGSLVKALSNLGYSGVHGIDPFLDKDIVTDAFSLRKAGIESYPGRNLFDVVIFNHSFEHMANPLEVLLNAKRLMKKDGIIIIRVPVADSYAFSHYRENWVQIDAPRHLFLHTNVSMSILVSMAKMKIKKIINDSDEFQFIGSEQYSANIALGDVRSYYVPWYKKLVFNKRHIFNKNQILEYKKKAIILNGAGEGDQRAFYIGL